MAEPQDYERKPLTVETGQAHVVKLPPRVFRARLTGMLFETDKTFLLPGAMNGVRGLRSYYEDHAGLEVLVTGHTDTVGDAGYNEGLAAERAMAVSAFLTDEVDAWLGYYGSAKRSKLWGTREDQYMLAALPEGGEPYYVGGVDGVPGPATTEAVKRFQREHGLAEDGVAGPDTRRALVTDYMALDGTSLPPGTPLQTHGCGEAHPTVPTPDQTDEPANRRVEVFLFEGPIEPPPRDPCRDCPEYAEWLRRTVHTIDLGDDPGWLDVAIVDGAGRPLPEVRIVADGPTAAAGVTGADGTVRFELLIPGRYHVTAEHERFDPAGTDIEIRAGHPSTERAARPDAPAEPPPFQPVSSPGSSAEPRKHGFAADGDGAPAGGEGAPPSSDGASRLEQAGDNTLVGWMLATIHVIITEQPTNLRDRAREHFGPADDQPWAADKLWFTAHRDGASSTPYAMSVSPMNDGSKRGHTAVGMPFGPKTIGLSATLSLQRTGPHQAPIIWQLDPDQPLGDTGWVGDKLNTLERNMAGRARISMWANGTEIVEHDKKSNNMRRTGRIAKAAGLIDDVSLIAGLFNQPGATTVPPTFMLTSPAGEVAARAWYAAIIDECHKAGIQILAGWGLPDVITEGTKPGPNGYSGRLNAWLTHLYGLRRDKGDAGATEVRSQFEQFAGNLLSAADVVPGWDGISFDLESIHLPPNADRTLFHSVLGDMYRAVAERLRVNNRICAVAVGGNTSDETVAGVKAPPFAQAHSFMMAKGAPNLILRARAYDNGDWQQPTPEEVEQGKVGYWRAAGYNSDPAQLELHRGVIDYALDEKKLNPAQFQLGIKTLQLPEKEANTKLKNPMLGGNVHEQARLVARATQLLRPARCGAAWFTLGTTDDFWDKVKAFNTALNGPPAIAPMTLGQPLHVPHDEASLARVKKR